MTAMGEHRGMVMSHRSREQFCAPEQRLRGLVFGHRRAELNLLEHLRELLIQVRSLQVDIPEPSRRIERLAKCANRKAVQLAAVGHAASNDQSYV